MRISLEGGGGLAKRKCEDSLSVSITNWHLLYYSATPGVTDGETYEREFCELLSLFRQSCLTGVRVKNYEHYHSKNLVAEIVNYRLKIKLYTCSENTPVFVM